MQLIKLLHFIILAAECNTLWIFSQARYKRFPRFLNEKRVQYDLNATNLFPNASSRIRSRMVFPIDCLQIILRVTTNYSIFKITIFDPGVFLFPG